MPWLKNSSRRLIPGKSLWCFLVLCHWMIPDAFGQTPSVLSRGDCYKIGVTSTGVYKLDAAYLKQIGIDVNQVDPQQIALYGNGSGMLPQPNSEPRPIDLQPVAIQVDLRNDGKTEAVYFFGEGATVVSFDNTKNRFVHQTNPYSDTTFYFLTVQNSPGVRIATHPAPPPSSASTIHAFDHYWFYEKESVNLLKSGRAWWGDYLGATPTLNFEIAFPGLIPAENALLDFAAIAAAQTPTQFVWQINGAKIGEQEAGTVSTYRYDLKAQIAKGTYAFPLQTNNTEKLQISLTYNKNGQSGASAYLDYVSLQAKRELKAYQEPTLYRLAPDTTQARTLSFSGIRENFILWDVSNPRTPKNLTLQQSASSQQWLVPSNGGLAQTLFGFDKTQALSPPSVRKIPNQHIRSAPTPDLILVTAPEWMEEAGELASFRQSHDGLDVFLVTPEQIYNEFSSGKTDVTAIRDLCKHFYNQDPGKLKYLLLFGDATFDYRNKRATDTEVQRANWIPTYQSYESLHPVYTFASDDYFGFLDDDSGAWNENAAGDHALQIGIGRIPVKNKAEARLVVDKLTDYATQSQKGKWKNRITFIADNGDQNIHQYHADQLAQQVSDQFLASRIFIDEYPLVGTSLGNRAPQINNLIKKVVNEGTMILNFTGHGDESGLTDEQILTLADMQSFSGYKNLPLLVTATCEFGRYDDPSVVSGAEFLTLSPKGAAIGALTTTRPVFSSTNFSINSAFYTALTSGHTRLGDLIRVTKNNSLAGALNRNFTLIGDPSLRLALPELTIELASANDTLPSLAETKIKGSITDPATGLVQEDFNGIAHISIYDQPTEFKTLGALAPAATYREYRTKLFEGQVSVAQGKFEANLILPDGQTADLRKGLLSVYAHSSDQTTDARGQSAIVIRPATNTLNDLQPPVISAFLNESQFQDGQEVSPHPTLHITLEDDHGFSISSTELHCGISVILNDTLALPVDNYFSANLDSFQQATVLMPLNIDQEGEHTLKIASCDLVGNKTEKIIRFRIKKEPSIRIHSTVTFPNPFREKITFRFKHNRPGHDLEIHFRLFDKMGREVFNTQFTQFNADEIIEKSIDPFRRPALTKPELEIYLYDISVRSLEDMTTSRVSGKLIQH